ncbi:MAG: CBS domain-containing protein [Anaerolineae bacterium]|nr:CBS domain-containing protein [Anaerolineae bacterium]MDW8098155.1 CBS domain-containing protein [Anaerolineae bacterium]
MIVLEHSLIMLLLLVGLLNARPRLPTFVRWAITGVLALAFVVPTVPIELPWDWFSALIIPLVLWQTARRLVDARWPTAWRDIAVWIWMVVGIGGLLAFTSELALTSVLLFSLLAASMAWRALEEEERPTYLGQLGPLVLAFLLAEIAPAVEVPNRYLVALAGGVALGAIAGYTAVRIALQIPGQQWRDIISIGQVYLVYGLAWLLGVSSVVATLFSIAVYVAYGEAQGVWSNGIVRPRPLDAGPIFGLAVAALAFFAWQTHVPLTPMLFLEVSLSLLVTGIAVWGRHLFRSQASHVERSFLNVLARVGLLLTSALLLWPREALIDPVPLALAFLVAGAVTFGVHLALSPLLNLYAWLDEANADVECPEQAVHALKISSLMTREFATARPDTPVPELARQLFTSPTGCVLIVEADGRLVGIVTESDLFVKFERLPRTGLTYPALFGEPVKPEELPNVYAGIGAKYVAADVMNRNVVWVKDTQSVGRAIRLMVQHGFRRLPVVNADPASGGRVVGVLTRGDIIRWLSNGARTTRHTSS